MELSRYLRIFPQGPGLDQRLVLNLKTGAKVQLRQSVLSAIDQDALSSEEKTRLLDLGIIVSNHQTETESVKNRLRILNRKSTFLRVTVVLNLDCNFSCRYCYEGDLKGNRYMSHQTADQLVSFIGKQLTTEKKTLLVDFYGGEPLMSLGLIDRISKTLLDLVRDRGIKFSSALISNGSLFTRKTAKRLAPLGLQSVKFTLDGPADIHDRYRPFKSGPGSFDRVFNNILETCDLVNVAIGGNYDQHSYPEFVRLLDHMIDKGLTPERVVSVKFDPILKPTRSNPGLAHYQPGLRLSAHVLWRLPVPALCGNRCHRQGQLP